MTTEVRLERTPVYSLPVDVLCEPTSIRMITSGKASIPHWFLPTDDAICVDFGTHSTSYRALVLSASLFPREMREDISRMRTELKMAQTSQPGQLEEWEKHAFPRPAQLISGAAEQMEEEEEEEESEEEKEEETLMSFKTWKALSSSKNELMKTPDLKMIGGMSIFAVILCQGGRFAGAIFRDGQVQTQKTFSHYVSRKKQGGRQVSADKSSTHHSVGASIRRQQEKQHYEKVHRTLEKWRPILQLCSTIHVHAPGSNQKIVFYDDGPISMSDVRAVPMSIRRITHSEVLRVHRHLCSVVLMRW